MGVYQNINPRGWGPLKVACHHQSGIQSRQESISSIRTESSILRPPRCCPQPICAEQHLLTLRCTLSGKVLSNRKSYAKTAQSHCLWNWLVMVYTQSVKPQLNFNSTRVFFGLQYIPSGIERYSNGYAFTVPFLLQVLARFVVALQGHM